MRFTGDQAEANRQDNAFDDLGGLGIGTARQLPCLAVASVQFQSPGTTLNVEKLANTSGRIEDKLVMRAIPFAHDLDGKIRTAEPVGLKILRLVAGEIDRDVWAAESFTAA